MKRLTYIVFIVKNYSFYTKLIKKVGKNWKIGFAPYLEDYIIIKIPSMLSQSRVDKMFVVCSFA